MPAVGWSDLATAVSRINSQSLLEVSIGNRHLCWDEVLYWTACAYCRNFCKEKNLEKCICKFRCKYPDSPVLTKLCVSKLVKKWRGKGSVGDIKKHSNRIVLTDEKFRDIEAWLQIIPRKSLGHLAQETGVSLGSAVTATKLIKFCPYKITVVHEVKQYGAMKILTLYS
jgi:hypothetical protein